MPVARRFHTTKTRLGHQSPNRWLAENQLVRMRSPFRKFRNALRSSEMELRKVSYVARLIFR